jgi:hypothetical protein
MLPSPSWGGAGGGGRVRRTDTIRVYPGFRM